MARGGVMRLGGDLGVQWCFLQREQWLHWEWAAVMVWVAASRTKSAASRSGLAFRALKKGWFVGMAGPFYR